MKGFLIINRINDLLFADCDDAFIHNVNSQAIEEGLLQPEDSDGKLDRNVVMQLFSPLFMSQWFLIDHKKNPCLSITCENDYVFVFKQFEDLLLIMIIGDKTESEEFMHRKACVFVRLMEFLFGPAIEELGHSKFTDRSDRWAFVRGVLSTYTQLVMEEQSFLVEAVERLQVNQTVNVKCMELLESAINKIQKSGEKATHHALLVVNSKLLSLYSDRNSAELQAADTLSIILLVQQMFPNDEKLEDFFAFSYRKPDPVSPMEEVKSPALARTYPPHRELYESALEGDDEDSVEDADDQYQSARDTPPRRSTRESFSTAVGSSYPQVSEMGKELTPTLDSDPKLWPTGEQGLNVPTMRGRSRTSEDVHTGMSSWRNLFGAGRARSASMMEHPSSMSRSGDGSKSDSMKSLVNDTPPPILTAPQRTENESYVRQTVFLCTDTCTFSPHQLHCLQIYPGMVLVLVSQVPLGGHADKLCQLLLLLKDLLSGRRTRVHRAQGQELFDIINSLLNKLMPAMKKIKGTIAVIFNKIRAGWDKPEFKNLLLEYLENASNVEIPPSVERALNLLLKRVKELFLYMYLLPRDVPSSIIEAVKVIHEKAKVKLRDYKDYLAVKAQRNITMTTYLDMFPGLVHFIYIDRKTNQVMAPSLNITTGEDGTESDATQLFKEKIWKMIEWVQLKLKNGITMVTTKDGDYHFSYFLWFEDCNGAQMPVQRQYQASLAQSPPGILSGNFYRNLTRESFPNAVPGSINCYELMMMHIGLVHSRYIVEHCQKLTRMMWEISGDPYSPMSLVW
ncbi:Hermansky-Pudlak syndrome 1 protein homolog isoform X2 [Mizuhopecten yessoensis]|uniref:Hermansky-Pudlak syndrome 1 protein homolog isoform X2 n=1 Tax=Mizuhopecten yessoensis TaxID=6573 RepID=UPI000B45A044|nr:Hermansky-Pudlak syndrome 1 protein homolog isoform X2 [Mizuhopecten yessoensis]